MQGKKVTIQVPIELFINNEKIEEVNIKKSERSLGVYINPTLKWEKQFEIIKETLQGTLCKLK